MASRVLFLTTYDPNDASRGGASWVDRRLLSDLRADNRVHVAVVCDDGSWWQSVPLEVRRNAVVAMATVARMVLFGEPYQSAKFRCTPAWHRRGRRLKEEIRDFDVVITDQWPALLLASDAGIDVDLHIVHNVDTVLAELYDPVAFRFIKNARRMTELEQELLRHPRQLACLSSSDQERLSAWGLASSRLDLLSAPNAASSRGKRRIGFVGKMSWPPNRSAADALVYDVMPLVRGQLGPATPVLCLAGRGSETYSGVGVEGLGRIDDLDRFYEAIDLVVVPRMEMGTGISVKLLEALERGIPVIAPARLARDAGVVEGVIAAESAAGIADAIVRFYAHEPLLSLGAVGVAGRRVRTVMAELTKSAPGRVPPVSPKVSAVTGCLDGVLYGMAPKLVASQRELFASVLSGEATRTQTVNLHHLYLAKKSEAFARSIVTADRTTADGWPVRLCMRRLGHVVERVTGSGFVTMLLEKPLPVGVRLGLLGSTSRSGDAFAELLGRHGAALHYREHGDKLKWSPGRIVEELRRARVTVLLIAVTPPFGDLFAAQLHDAGYRGAVLPVGGAIDMRTGLRKPTHPYAAAVGLEWAHRLLQDPRRMMRRYLAQCLPVFVGDLLPFCLKRPRRDSDL